LIFKQGDRSLCINPIDSVFFAIRHFYQVGLLPNTEFCQGLIELNKKGEIIIHPDSSTNVQGIFACGDVTNCSGKRKVIASGEGVKAALSVKRYLLQLRG
jgi:alkyl hydroperoxide reductase subunit F